MKYLVTMGILLVSTSGFSCDLSQELYDQFQKECSNFTHIRHELHQIPEIKYEEFKTSSFVAQILESYGYTVTRGIGGTGISALLDSGIPGKTVALRADMDGLPISEETALDYSSSHNGKMHACGHDGHMATLLMVAKVLKEGNYLKSGKIRFIFQPAEEGGAGADRMIKAGILESPKVDAIFGYHNWPAELGVVATRVGCLLAGADRFDVKIEGKGGHAAMPHMTNNPIYAASQIISSSQNLVSQGNPTEPTVLNITSIHGGTTYNVVPNSIAIQGTLRTTSLSTRESFVKKFTDLCKNTAKAHDTTATVTFVPDNYPPTINSKNEAELVIRTAKEILEHDMVKLFDQPVMPAEDFSFYLQKVPGCFFLVGYGESKPGLHQSTYNFTDSIMPIAGYILAKTALNFLANEY